MAPVFTPNEAAEVLLSMAGRRMPPSAPSAPALKSAPPRTPVATKGATRVVVAAAFATCPPTTPIALPVSKTIKKPPAVKNSPKTKILATQKSSSPPDFGVSHAPPGWPSVIRPAKGLLKTPLTKAAAALLEYEFSAQRTWYPGHVQIQKIADKIGLSWIETSMWFKYRRCLKNAQKRLAADAARQAAKKTPSPLPDYPAAVTAPLK